MSTLLTPEALARELDQIAAESIGWQPLAKGAYLHVGNAGDSDEDEIVITITGVPDASMAGMNVLLLT